MPPVMPGEAFGGWFGRIAARCGLGVDEPADAGGIRLAFGGSACAWIAAQAPSGTSPMRLCEASGVGQRDIEAMRVTNLGPEPADGYCFRTLVLNPPDVASPFRHRRWLEASRWACREHPGELDAVNRAELRAHRDMARLLDLVGHRHRRRAH